MGILLVPIALALKLVNLLLWLAITALKLAWRLVVVIFALIRSLISAVLPGRKKADDGQSSCQERC